MVTTMADRLAVARRQGFVGRRAELALFEGLLAAPEPAVLFVHGPAGVGKSTLLGRFAELAEAAGLCRLAPDGPPTDGPATGRGILLVDGYEPVDRRVREELLPRLPGDTLAVLAGQQPPGPGWTADPGWSPLVRVLELGNLAPAEAAELLALRGVPAALHGRAVAFTRGHPLALALVGDGAPDHGPDVIRALLDRFLAQVPSPRHRAALDAAAVVRAMTEPLLGALLDEPEPGPSFAWLRGLPFVASGPDGLSPHDLVRELLVTDLRWRDPDRALVLHERARAYCLARLDSDGRAVPDLIHLHDELRPLLQPELAGVHAGPAGPGDLEAVAAMVARHEGEESAGWARAWAGHWQVIRDRDGGPAGGLCLLDLTAAGDTGDPAVLAARRELAAHPPLRPGERATLVRFWLAAEEYQALSPVQSLVAVLLARHYLGTAGLALTLLPFAEPDAWAAYCAYADQHRLPGADFAVGGRTYGVYGHDWRVVTPSAWVELLARRETGAAPPDAAPPARLLVLDEAAFAAAVRRALRDLTRPERLRGNPLLGCRLVTARADGIPARVAALQDLVRAAVEGVRADERLYPVLHRAYVAPAPSLERAAEALGLPSSTFRRHLAAAVERITATLWHQELDA